MKLTLLGSAKGHKFKAEQDKDGSCEIVSWLLPDGRQAPKKAGLVGKTFSSARAAGVAVYLATHEHYGFPERTIGRSLVFKADTADKKMPPRLSADRNGAIEHNRVGVDDGTRRDFTKFARDTSPDPAVAALKRPSGALPKIPGERRGDIRTSIQATRDQLGVAEGYMRFWCVDCGDGFVARPIAGLEGPEPPARCLKGHVNIDLRPNVH